MRVKRILHVRLLRILRILRWEVAWNRSQIRGYLPIGVLALTPRKFRGLVRKSQMLHSIGVILSLHGLEEILAFDALTVDCCHYCDGTSLRGGCCRLHLQVSLRRRRGGVSVHAIFENLVRLTNEDVEPPIDAFDRCSQVILFSFILSIVTPTHLQGLLRRLTWL